MVKIGILGLSPGNGHPYSFSAILNGFVNDPKLWSDWEGIRLYLERRDPSELAAFSAQVTHVWTQERQISDSISQACKVAHVVVDPKEMIGSVDAVILARDDYANHREMAEPFLNEGLPVFIDKPLSVSLEDLKYFAPHLRSGKLMSCSGLHFAKELSEGISSSIREEAKFVSAQVLSDWQKYGIHMIDAICGVRPFRAKSIFARKSDVFSASILCEDGLILSIQALGATAKTFHIEFWSEKERQSVEISDNFSAFKSTMGVFLKMLETGEPVIDPDWTLHSMKILIAGMISSEENREVIIDEIVI